ncbi:uncharacterized protein LOC130591775 [Beta vulgaris subsp. vulgaris]|uniref:uncharacterized protein LOC130591775 n=1 Tax=Beta vulgaris subsp. vulgaris TaxID=3555 RepID=UPI002548552A|nr:uncharacterized protein LOC130591775 [Beta vulgaris subsp. vulgaris]
MSDVRGCSSQRLAQIRLEEDMQSRKAYAHADSRKATPNKQAPWRQKPYERPQQVHSVRHDGPVNDWKNDPGLPPKLSEYGFNVTMGGIINTLHSLGSAVKWPFRNEKSTAHRDKSKWCEFHGDHGHHTDECVALRREVSHLLKQGYLKDLLTEKGKQTVSKDDDRRQPPSSPPHVKVINVISGGSDICGLTYSAAKRHARDGLNQDAVPKELRHPRDIELETMPITFDDADLGDDRDIHHDGLFSKHPDERRLEDMGIDERDVIRKSTVLVGFSGESKHTMGEVTLPTFAKGVNMPTKFYVIDCPSSYM